MEAPCLNKSLTLVTLKERDHRLNFDAVTLNLDNNNNNKQNKSEIHSKFKLTDINDSTEIENRIDSKKLNHHNNDREKLETSDGVATRDDVMEKKTNKKSDVYGRKGSLRVRSRVYEDVYGTVREAADYKLKWARAEWTEAMRRTMHGSLHVWSVVCLCLAMLATSAATPASLRTHHGDDRTVRSYLQNFGYLKKGTPEVGNLLSGDSLQDFEDEFRIAVKTLQEFGGIPVTGEIDETTKELIGKKRCGRPDREADEGELRRKKRYAIHGETWKHTNLTWSLSSVRRPSQLDPYATRRVMARALDVWEQASKLTFTEINSDNADIVVSFAKRFHDDSYPFDGRGTLLAHAFFPGSGYGGDAHFDDEELWLLQPTNDEEEGTSLFAVAAHEFGHSLGLSHSSVKGALMFPWYQGIQPNFVLPEDDRNGIQQMYGPKEKVIWGKNPYYHPVETAPPPPPPTTTTTTTTTRRPFTHHHHNHHWDRHPNHRTTYLPYPRQPSRYPVYYPEKSPERPPVYPGFPPKHNHNHNPRPNPETTTQVSTYKPRYPNVNPQYPSYPNHPHYPSDPKQDTPKREYPKRKPQYPEKTTPKPTPPPYKPEKCDTTYDAVTLIRGELFIFKDKYHWRIGARGHYDGYPIEITRMWSSLPSNLTHVDAVYERPDGKIVFFIGKKIYLFDSRFLVEGYPKELVHLGLPSSLEKIDAAMIWGHNGKTYFYSGSVYWKFDEYDGRVDVDYPRDMSMWKGVGYNIDSVFQWKDGKTYFFKAKGYWKFNDLKMRVEQERQMPSAAFWMGCPGERAGRRAPLRTLPAPGSTLRSLSGAPISTPHSKMTILSSLLSLIITAYYYLTLM